MVSLRSKTNLAMDMIQHLHSILRWALLIVLLYSVFVSYNGMMKKQPFTPTQDKAGLWLTILADVQLLLGFLLYFLGGLGLKNIRQMGMGEVMKNSYFRFFAMEHLLMMLVAIVLLHIGRAKSKKAAGDAAKHKNAFWFYVIALVLILSSIPWPFRPGFEMRGWF